MRLINTISLTFREFFDSQRPPYAILSHTWEDQEVSYLDFLFLTSNPHKDVMGAIQALLKNPSTDSRGFKKITSWCKLARGRGYEWVWIDTYCIDKSSSAELSEAINSMWRWYREAQDCFVYLLDVSASPNKEGMQEEEMRRNQQVFYEQLSNARWFTRGWTLQELLAPKHVLFCNNRWEVIASKSSIGAKLSEITRIPLVFLDGTYAPNDGKICSVAMRMSWVSQRQTTRLEDMAYCMLGLFDGESRTALYAAPTLLWLNVGPQFTCHLSTARSEKHLCAFNLRS
ncbi:MAG: hypothetical protein M1822_009970 [Bathelium mastoideum]|nr:MAG: hypothetical protein M1822_009970 [Bathelium mastoideum]